MANSGLTNDEIIFDFDSNGQPYFRAQPWPIMNDVNAAGRSGVRRNVTPIQTHNVGLRQTTMSEHPMLEHWRYQQTQAHLDYHPQQSQQPHQHQHHHQHHQQQQPQQQLDMPFNDFNHGLPMTSQSMELISVSQAPLNPSIPLNASYMQMTPGIEGMPHNWSDFQTELVSFSTVDAGVAVSPYQQQSSSPTGSHLEVLSQQSSCDEAGWTLVDSTRQSFESYERPYFIDPTQTLHNRALSESSYSDLEQPSHFSLGNNLDMMSNQAVCSPTSLSDGEFDFNHVHSHQYSVDRSAHHSADVSPSSLVNAISIPSKKGSPSARSPSSQGSASSPGRKTSRKSPIAKATDKIIKKQSSGRE